MPKLAALSLRCLGYVCLVGCGATTPPVEECPPLGSVSEAPAPKVSGATPLTGEARVESLLSQMTQQEKLSLLGGTGFDTVGVDRLGIPPLKMTDGPIGVRKGPATRFPAGVSLAATFNPELVERVGAGIGKEVRAHGMNVLLAPCVNIHRTPLGGRNFESYGEDPYLASRTATAYIKGVQSAGVVATVKHFAVNNQETERMSIDVRVDERAMNEIYLPAFEAAVRKANVQAVMCAYNKVQGAYACENSPLLKDILTERWGFSGLVMSDWGALHSTVPSVKSGTHLEMPTGKFYDPKVLAEALEHGQIEQREIDEMVRRQLRVIVNMGFMSPAPLPNQAQTELDNRSTNREAARESFVLLKNEGGILPLEVKKLRKLVVVGPSAAHIDAGGGSAHVDATHEVTLLDALRARLGSNSAIDYYPGTDETVGLDTIPASALAGPEDRAPGLGLVGSYYDNEGRTGQPRFVRQDPSVEFRWNLDGPRDDMPKDSFSIEWKGTVTAPKSGKYLLAVESDDGSRLYLDDKLIVDNWGGHPPVLKSAEVTLKAGQPRKIRLEYYESIIGASVILKWKRLDPTMLARAIRAAKAADVAIVAVGNTEGDETEGRDRDGWALPRRQADLVSAIAKANPNTVVVLSGGAPLDVDRFLPKVDGLLMSWFPGQEAGDALVDVLTGEVSPSGRLPITWPVRREDASDFGGFPGEDGKVEYSESLFVGYRHFDRGKVSPRFPFGFGLGYSKFEYRDLTLGPISAKREMTVKVLVKNVGARKAAETVQLYVHPMASRLLRPEQELKAFEKVELMPGEQKAVELLLDAQSFAFYDPEKHAWVTEAGEFELRVGSSSRDLGQRVMLRLP